MMGGYCMRMGYAFCCGSESQKWLGGGNGMEGWGRGVICDIKTSVCAMCEWIKMCIFAKMNQLLCCY